MSVIKEEFISDKITRHDILPVSFLKKSAYTGSKKHLRYRMARTEAGEADQKTTVLRVWTWNGPFAFDKTPLEQMEIRDFSFDQDGLDLTLQYLNACLEASENDGREKS